MWVGRIDLGYVDGKRKRKVVYGRTQAAAIKAKNAAQKAIDAGDVSTAGTTLEAWLRYWLEEVCPAKRRMKPSTLRTYQGYVDNHIVPAIGRVRLDRLGMQHVRALRKHVESQVNRNGEPLSITTALHAHRILSTALNDAMREGKLTRNVASLEGAPEKAEVAREALSVAEVRALFAQVAADRLASRWEAALTLGARQGECLGLTWEHVDLRAGIADLAWQLQRIPYRHGCGSVDGAWQCGHKPDRCPKRELSVRRGFEHRQLDGNLCLIRPKTRGSIRRMVLPDPLLASFQRRHAAYLAERGGWKVDHGLVWARGDGRPIDGRRDYREWQDHLKAAGIPPMPLHSARHTAATVLESLGISEHVVMSMLGHSEAVTTRRYQHVDLTMQRRAMAELGAAYAG